MLVAIAVLLLHRDATYGSSVEWNDAILTRLKTMQRRLGLKKVGREQEVAFFRQTAANVWHRRYECSKFLFCF